VPRSADDRAIKKAYRAAAMEWHPDKHTGETKDKAERMFRDIAEAYEVLTDADKRSRYDRGEDVTGNPQQGGPGGPFGGGFPGGGPFGFQQGGFHFRFG
jgi:DnaJ-class molecular chaperone